VNDVPFYRRVVDHNAAPAGPFNHFLVPGTNVVTIALSEVEGVLPAHVIAGFDMKIQRQEDDKILFHQRWPDFGAEYPEEKRKLPIVHTRSFTPEIQSPAPIWEDAPRGWFPPEGTPEQRDAVLDLHTAYARGDADGFLSATGLKMDLHRKYYGPVPEVSPAAARARVTSQLSEPWDVAPVNFDELVFEHHADGRVAYVTRKDGGPALFAQHKADPTQAWTANLYLTRPRRPDGSHEPWRIYW
jgi:hypothetical protein